MKHYENHFSTNKYRMKHWKFSYQSISILTHDIRIIPFTKWKNVVFWGWSEPTTTSAPIQDEVVPPFWGWTKNTSSPLPKGFLGPFSTPIFSLPTYLPPSHLPPTYLPQLISHSLHLQSAGKLPSLSSIELRRNMRHKARGRWRAQHWRNMKGNGKKSASSQMQNQERKGKLPPFSAFFFFSMFFFFSFA